MRSPIRIVPSLAADGSHTPERKNRQDDERPNHNRGEPAIWVQHRRARVDPPPARRDAGIRIKISSPRVRSFPGGRAHRLNARNTTEDRQELGEVKSTKAGRT